MFQAILLIIRRLNCINTASDVITLHRWPYGAQIGSSLATCAPYSYLWRVMTPNAVLIQFNLLMMSKIARNMQRIVINVYTGCPRRKGPNFGRVFLRSNYTNITQNTYIQS
jgi:hypothetical protein